MNSSMIGMWRPLVNMFKLEGMMCYRNALMSNSLYSWYALLLKPIAVYMLATVSSYWMILSVLLELKISAVRKAILDYF